MPQNTQISPLKAVLICINTMIGAGLFINANKLAQFAGPFGFLGYAIAAVILFPLILCIAELARLHPVAGGLYVYSKTYLGPWAGFISAWGYFIGKTASATLLMHKFVEFFQERIDFLQLFPTLLIDFCMIFLVVGLNSAGVSVGGRVQYLFTLLKAIPILFIFGAGCIYFDPIVFYQELVFSDIISTLSIAVFPLLGFEVICAIGNMIKDPERNIKNVILTSFLLVAGIDILFQLVMYGILGLELSVINEPLLMAGLKTVAAYPLVASIINGAVFAAIIGACFSILTSNCWNLHTIARHGHLPGSSLLTRVNAYNVPWVSLLCEAVLGCMLLWITSEQLPLQRMSVFAQVLCYLTSAIAAAYAVHAGATKRLARFIPVLGIVGSLFIMGICLRQLIVSGISAPFLAIFLIGVIAAIIKYYQTKHTT